MLFHPRWSHLFRLAHEPPSADMSRAQHHVARCAQCQAIVDDLARSRALLRDLPAPQLPTRLRVAAPPIMQDNVYVLLPDDQRQAAPIVDRSRRIWSWAAAAVVTAVVGWQLWNPAPVDATGSVLRFTPHISSGRVEVDVRYFGPTVPFDRAQLTLRARLRQRDDGHMNDELPIVALATLTRQAKGEYTGRFVWPDSAVYLVAAVDDTLSWTDDHGGRLWELLTPHADGAYYARRQQVADRRARDWTSAHQLAKSMVRDYPDSAAVWFDLINFDQRLSSSDSVKQLHARTLARLDQQYRAQQGITPQAMADLFYYAWAVAGVAITNDSLALPPAMQYWRSRIRQSPGLHPRVAELQLTLANSLVKWERQDELLRVIEATWDSVPAVRSRYITGEGIRTARRLGDANALLRWERRLADVTPSVTLTVARILTNDSMTWREGLPTLEALLRDSEFARDHSRWRPLTQSRPVYAEQLHAVLARAWMAVATARLRAGDSVVAAAALKTAGGMGWDADVQNKLATLWMSQGDSVRAVAALAALSVDPLRGRSFADSVYTLYRKQMPRARWDSLRAHAHGRMRRAVMSELRAISVRGTPSVYSQASNRAITLRDLRAGPNGARTTAVAFWSIHCEPSVSALSTLGAVASGLASRGSPLVIVALERQGAAAALHAAGVTGPVYDDRKRSLSVAVGQWMTPQAFVFSADGHTAYEFSGSLERLERAVAMLDADRR
ncbi:MAG: hypothetical protein IT353_13770 [Gemmatimonadaceae bacterium]|nr:hypothetical protein [Gemmatimonadaceae bacterium]